MLFRSVLETAEARWQSPASRRLIGTGNSAAAAFGFASVAADPDVAFVVDRDAVVRNGPVVTLPRSAPVADQIAGLIEFENGWRGFAALRDRRITCGVMLARFERPGPVDDPDVILRVDGHANGLTEYPMIRQWLRPQGIHFKSGRLYSRALQEGQKKECHNTDSRIDNALHDETLYAIGALISPGRQQILRLLTQSPCSDIVIARSISLLDTRKELREFQ